MLNVKTTDPEPTPDGYTTKPEQNEELERMRRLDNPFNLYSVSRLALDPAGTPRLFQVDAFPSLALAEFYVRNLAAEGKAGGLVILAEAAKVARKLGER